LLEVAVNAVILIDQAALVPREAIPVGIIRRRRTSCVEGETAGCLVECAGLPGEQCVNGSACNKGWVAWGERGFCGLEGAYGEMVFEKNCEQAGQATKECCNCYQIGPPSLHGPPTSMIWWVLGLRRWINLVRICKKEWKCGLFSVVGREDESRFRVVLEYS
jgi:hypothetical protein